MTRLPIDPVNPPIPHSITMGELAITAGLAGRGLVLCWQDFPAPILYELWRHFAAWAGPGRVLQVSSQADVRKLSERATELRLILEPIRATRPPLYVATDWPLTHCRGPRLR